MLKKVMLASLVLILSIGASAYGDSPADLNDLEIAQVAYTADSIDIRYAHLALAISKNPVIHAFARTMIRDHEAVNDEALALVTRLNVAPQDNFLSRQLNAQADQLVPLGGSLESLGELWKLVEATAKESGRDPSAIELTYSGMATLDYAQQVEQAGAQRMLIASVEPDLDSAKKTLGEFSENVIAKLGSA